MDDATFVGAFEPIAGTTLTTAVYSATTIDNPAFGVMGGQNVEILLLQINSEIPVNFLFSNLLAANKQSLVELAHTIAASDELVSRITDFIGP